MSGLLANDIEMKESRSPVVYESAASLNGPVRYESSMNVPKEAPPVMYSSLADVQNPHADQLPAVLSDANVKY